VGNFTIVIALDQKKGATIGSFYTALKACADGRSVLWFAVVAGNDLTR